MFFCRFCFYAHAEFHDWHDLDVHERLYVTWGACMFKLCLSCMNVCCTHGWVAWDFAYMNDEKSHERIGMACMNLLKHHDFSDFAMTCMSFLQQFRVSLCFVLPASSFEKMPLPAVTELSESVPHDRIAS